MKIFKKQAKIKGRWDITVDFYEGGYMCIKQTNRPFVKDGVVLTMPQLRSIEKLAQMSIGDIRKTLREKEEEPNAG